MQQAYAKIAAVRLRHSGHRQPIPTPHSRSASPSARCAVTSEAGQPIPPWTTMAGLIAHSAEHEISRRFNFPRAGSMRRTAST